MTEPKLDSRSRVRIEGVVRRLDLRLDGRVPARRRRQIRKELRANLAEAAAAKGTDEAVRQLGDLRHRAASYLEAEAGRVDARTGIVAALVTFAVLQMTGLLTLVAYRDGFEAAGGDGGWSYSYEVLDGWGPFSAASSGDSVFEIHLLMPAHLILMAIAFVVGGRAWRALSRRPAPTGS